MSEPAIALAGGAPLAAPPAVPAAAPAPTDSAAWHAGLDAETRGYAENRGLLAKDPVTAFAEAARAHREAQAHIGAPAEQLLRLPKADAPAEEWKPVWQRLGAPADPSGYDLTGVKFADGTELDATAVDFFRKTAADLHLPAAQAPRLAGEFVKFLEANEAAEAAEQTAKLATQKGALKANWGQNFNANMVIAQQAFAALTPSAEAMAALEGVVGYDQVLEMFRKIGAQMGEARFVTNGMPTPGIMTVDAAKDRITELKSDSEWVKRFLAGGAAEKREMDNLHSIAYSPAT
jgi:hypothetical protein